MDNKEEEKKVFVEDKTEETTGVYGESDTGSTSVEFNQVEHPVEPTGAADSPVKFPMPEDSVIFFEERRWEDMAERSLLKRSQSFTEYGSKNRGGSEEQQQQQQNSTGRLNKRHQSRKGSHTGSNIFQIFNQCKLEL